jgi:hypothetical protein
VGRLHGAVDGVEEVIADRVQFDRVAQPGGEGRDGRVGVVAGTVEASVHVALDADPERVEQGGRDERRGGNANTARERERVGGERDQPNEDPDQERGEDRVGERAADQPVDLIQPVFENADADAERQRGQPDAECDAADDC